MLLLPSFELFLSLYSHCYFFVDFLSFCGFYLFCGSFLTVQVTVISYLLYLAPFILFMGCIQLCLIWPFLSSLILYWSFGCGSLHVNTFFSRFWNPAPWAECCDPIHALLLWMPQRNLLKLFVWKIEPCSFVGPAS